MRLRARYAVAPLAAALILTGCARPGTAAIIDGERITEAQVATLTSELQRLQGSGTTQGAIANLISAGPVLDVATESGLGVSEQQGRELLDQIAAQSGTETWDYSDELVRVAQSNIALRSIQADGMLYGEANVRVQALDITINPRFGSWSGETGLVDPVWPWIIGSEAPGLG